MAGKPYTFRGNKGFLGPQKWRKIWAKNFLAKKTHTLKFFKGAAISRKINPHTGGGHKGYPPLKKNPLLGKTPGGALQRIPRGFPKGVLKISL